LASALKILMVPGAPYTLLCRKMHASKITRISKLSFITTEFPWPKEDVKRKATRRQYIVYLERINLQEIGLYIPGSKVGYFKVASRLKASNSMSRGDETVLAEMEAFNA
jgi:hypothetical protein